MLFHRKEKLYLGSFLRVYIGMLLRSKIEEPADSARNNVLTEIDRQRFHEELLNFRLAALLFALRTIRTFGRKTFTDHELGTIVGAAIRLAYRDAGLSDAAIGETLPQCADRLDHYLTSVEIIPPAEREEKGHAFFLVKAFADGVTQYTAEKLKSADFRDTHVTIFDWGTQVYRHDEAALRTLMSHTRFLDTEHL